MLQTMIERNSSIYSGLARLHDRYGEASAEAPLEAMNRVSWGIDAPRKSYAALSLVYGYLNTLYCEVFLSSHLTKSKKLQAELDLIMDLTARVETHINAYARYIAGEGRDRI